MRSDRPQIRLHGVDLVFGEGTAGVTALNQVSLEVADGEFVSIVGESGCGKTSLLRLVAGLERPSAGSVEVCGTPVGGPPVEVGFVFQRPVLLPWRRVIDNVLLPRQLAGRVDDETRAEAYRMLDMVGLGAFANKFPRQLSGGMQQRASIARTLLTKPSVMLMDEPFGALDAITRERLNLDLLEIWGRERSTCVFITHDIDEAVLLSDRVVLMSPRPGRVRREFVIDLPRPRTQEMRYSTEFTDLSREIHHWMVSENDRVVA